jgi:hypothetical protein
MTTATKIKLPTTLKDALKLSVDDLQTFNPGELAMLHTLVTEGTPTKQSKRLADLIAGIIQGKKKNGETAPAPTVENSVKTAPKKPTAPKAKTAPATVEPGSVTKAPEQEPGKPAPAKKTLTKKPTAPAPAPKKEEPKQPQQTKGKPAPVPAPKKKAGDVYEGLSPEQIAYFKELESKAKNAQVFPATIEGGNSVFTVTEYKDVKELQAQLMTNPYSVYCFMNERIDNKLTQFLVVYADDEQILLLDKNRQKGSTMSTQPEALNTLEHRDLKKQDLSFPVQFYTREVKAK